MKKLYLLLFFLMMAAVLFAQQQHITGPKEYFGFYPGDDRQLFNYEQLTGYLKELDNQSDRLKLMEIGKSPLGKPMYIVFLSSPGNLENLDRLKEINHQLALNTTLTEEQAEALSEEGKVFVYATLSMHSTEVGPSQSAALVAYKFATDTTAEVAGWLDDVVYMMVPSHNPDGMDMVVENYLKYRGTKYEGASLPGVYHKYVGHDNNRDFVILSQEDTKAIARVYNREWLPQVMVEKHQMGSLSARYFVPPMHDPIAVNVDAGLWTWTGIFGQNLINDMTNDGLAGVSQNYIFDNYWPGSTETCLWNNVIAFLTECASAREATPVYIEPNELMAYGKGISEYKKGINFPMPWEGGWWRLTDIVNYELASTRSIIKTASVYKSDILKFRNDVAKREVARGTEEAPFYYVIPRMQTDPGESARLINLLRSHGVQVYTLNSDMQFDGRLYSAGAYVVPLAQPYRALIKEFMEAQQYPERHYSPGGELMKPYDITSWSLPLHRNVAVDEIDKKTDVFKGKLSPLTSDVDYFTELPERFSAAVYSVEENDAYHAAFAALSNKMEVKRLDKDAEINGRVFKKGSFLIDGNNGEVWKNLMSKLEAAPVFIDNPDDFSAVEIALPRIALVETWFHDMDAGWTRFVFDQYNIPYKVFRPADLKEAKLSDNFDVLIFPDSPAEVLLNGKYKSESGYRSGNYAPEYKKGMEEKGKENVLKFINNGGVVLSWGRSTGLFAGTLKTGKGDDAESFTLPFTDISPSLKKKGLYVAGSLLKIDLVKENPLTYGMPASIGVFSRGNPVFSTTIPKFDMDRRVIAVYAGDDLLMSGYIEKPELLEDKSAMIWLKKGKGQLVLYGFSPQFRASVPAAYKLLFNGLLLK